jgi:pimeloyl-ACP methyl ester carboxylesterase
LGKRALGRRRIVQQPTAVHLATVSLSTGVTLHYAERGDRSGEAIVFLHAYTDSWFSYSRVLPLLSASYHAFAPDQRGHGDSNKPQCCYTADDFTADVDAFMEAVGIEEAILVGDSSGGMIAQRVALDYPQRVSRLVLIGSPTTLVNNEAVMEAGEQMLAGLEDPIPPEFVTEFWESTIHHPVPEQILQAAISQTLKVPARVWRDYHEGVALTLDDTPRLGEIDAPTLILWGERDAVLGHEEQERRAGAIPDATLKVYPDTGHAVTFERPEWVVRDLQEFIEGTRPAT